MRRLSEMKHVGKMIQIGLRGLGSSKKKILWTQGNMEGTHKCQTGT